MNDKTLFSWTRNGLGLAVTLLLAAACADEPTMPLGPGPDARDEAPAFAVQLTCTVDVEAETMDCDPSSPSGTMGGPEMNLIVGSQHQFVRLSNSKPQVYGNLWNTNVMVQNLTLQPFGTPDGLNVDPEGVRVFFVDEPNNGVEVLSHHGAEVFTGSEPQKFFRYGSAAFGADGILSPGEISGSVPWQFGLNGATTFQFSVLIATTVPDPAAYSAHLTRVAVGGRFACGEGADGKIYCWGANDHGQLGQGVANHQTATTPVAVRGPEGVRLSRPVAAYAQICAEGDDGRLYCWGRNNQGQLGTGDMTDRSVPTPVSAPEGVRLTNAAVGTQHTCAEGSDGHVYCWGIGGNGRLGNGETLGNFLAPVRVLAPEGVTLSKLTAGSAHTCAEGSDDTIYCWGVNHRGQIGDSTDLSRSVPTAVAAPHGVTLSNPTADGGDHTCAEGSDGNVYCWGNNHVGQLGDGTETDRLAPVPVLAPGDVRLSRPDAGSSNVCANGSDGRVYCWGDNFGGKVGIGGGPLTVSTPTAISAPAGVSFSDVSVGGTVSCAMSVNGRPFCWGVNAAGQVGDGTRTNRSAPVPVVGVRGA